MGKIQLVSEPKAQVSRATASSPQRDDRQVMPQVGTSLAAIREEIDDMFEEMRGFQDQEPDEVMRSVSGWTARFTELKVRIRRIEDLHRDWRALREREIDPIIDELHQQYVIASRLLSVRELDYRMSIGQP